MGHINIANITDLSDEEIFALPSRPCVPVNINQSIPVLGILEDGTEARKRLDTGYNADEIPG